MIDIIVKLEEALTTAGVDWETRYLPDAKAYVLKIDDDEVIIFDPKEELDDD